MIQALQTLPTNKEFRITNDPEKLRSLTGIWLRQIIRYPFAYLYHRSRVFLHLIGLRGKVHIPWIFAVTPNNYQIGPDKFGVVRFSVRPYTVMRHYPGPA